MTKTTEELYWDKAAEDPEVAIKYIADVDTTECLNAIVPHLNRGKVLEIGCGIGRLTTVISKYDYFDVYGIDISSKMLDLTPKSSVKYKITDGRNIPYSDETFDSVYSMLVFQHIPSSAKRDYIIESWRVLKPGGVFRVQYVEGDHHADIDHGSSQPEMLGWLDGAGFEVADIDHRLIHPQWNWITAIKRRETR